jgi:uncharacterized SAM-binding protein YcdF (DUF218 family)
MRFPARRRWLLLLSVAALVFLTLPLAFRSVGSWLVVQDPLNAADAIVVFGGHLPFRAIEAGKIYKQGIAPEVWVTRPAATTESAALQELEIGFVPEHDYSVRTLLRLGVPPSAVRLLDGEIVNTEDEVRATLQTLQVTGKKRVILVTSEYHCRRVKIIWHALAPPGLTAAVRSTPSDPFDPDRWWRNSHDSLAVTREIGGILNAWAGFPLKASRP